jgi:Flp pilus assembly protein CpaB
MSAVAFVSSHHARRQSPTEPVLVATRSIPAGAALAAADLTIAHWTPGQVPEHALTDSAAAVGKVVAAPAGRGEPITGLRLLDNAVTDALGPQQQALVLPIFDHGESSLITSGAHIDLYTASSGDHTGSAARQALLASDVRVLSIVSATGKPPVAIGSAVPPANQTMNIVIAASSAVAARVAAQAPGPLLATLRRPT